MTPPQFQTFAVSVRFREYAFCETPQASAIVLPTLYFAHTLRHRSPAVGQQCPCHQRGLIQSAFSCFVLYNPPSHQFIAGPKPAVPVFANSVILQLLPKYLTLDLEMP
jgi:hypothetical protein